jgi:hypothetical protein
MSSTADNRLTLDGNERFHGWHDYISLKNKFIPGFLIQRETNYFSYLLTRRMNTTKKIAIGLGLAGGAILAAWLLTGDRKQKTKEFIVRKTTDLRGTLKKEAPVTEDDINYV